MLCVSRLFVGAMSVQKNPRILGLMRSLLEECVGQSVVSARQVCDALLSNEHLSYEAEAFWSTCFGLVRRIIGGVYYKGENNKHLISDYEQERT